jgi:basic amino acid/polyamine antiporter, APA family
LQKLPRLYPILDTGALERRGLGLAESAAAMLEGGALGPVNLIALGIGAIIGAGLFSLTGIAAADHAGPAVGVLSFVVAAAIGCAFAGMCYSEFATMIPIAGSAYTYAYATMGELLAWIIGWDLVLEYAVGAATVAVSWSSYVNKLCHMFGVELPANLMHCPWDTTPGIINLPAIVVVCLISLLLMSVFRNRRG